MLSSTRTAALVLGLGLLSGGCGGPQMVPGSLDGIAAGTTALRVVNHVAAPDRLDAVSFDVDGVPVPLSSVPPSGEGMATIAALHLAPGPHSLAVRARARRPSGEIIVVGEQKPFHLGRGPAAITVDVRSAAHPGASSDDHAATPVAVALIMLGGRLAPELGAVPSDDKDERCAGLLPIPRALCRAAADLDASARNSDVVTALCVRDKLAEMRKLAIIGESGKGDSAALAEAQVAQLSRQVDLCAGDAVTLVGRDGLTVLPPAR